MFQTIAAGMNRVVAPAKRLFTFAAGATLAAMMFLTALDVGLRYLFNSPIPGGLELVEYMMAVIIPLAIAVAAYNRVHICVDLIMERFPRRVRTLAGCVCDLLSLFLYVLITREALLNISEQYASGMTSSVLLIPLYPFVASLAVAFALLSLIKLMHFFEKLGEVVS